MALSLAKPKPRSLINPSLVHLFSSSSSNDGPNFRASSTEPPVESTTAGPPNSNQEKPSSFQDLYKRHVSAKLEGNFTTQARPLNASNSAESFEAIRRSLRDLRPNEGQNAAGRGSYPGLFPRSRNAPNLIPGNAGGPVKSTVIGGTQAPTSPMFAEVKAEGGDSMATEFVKVYSTDELGDKLRSLRPEVKQKGWFSLKELNERLRKLRAKEEEEAAKTMGGVIREFRHSLVNLQLHKEQEMAKKSAPFHRLSLVVDEHLPPKEHLVEKYFHPDNMSSAEKLKLELANVREEFKMSESDCGSARVQVAQLTTKIKHLSSVLHKKDKHSRKGLNEMVQRRKKLLKYLRRTDWDSYCFVLSKLGLRDNANMKH